MFVVVLQNTSGARSHTVGINSGLKIICDCMETRELKLNKQNLNNIMDPIIDCVVVVAAELEDNKVHAKKLNMNENLTIY